MFKMFKFAHVQKSVNSQFYSLVNGMHPNGNKSVCFCVCVCVCVCALPAVQKHTLHVAPQHEQLQPTCLRVFLFFFSILMAKFELNIVPVCFIHESRS